MTVIQQSQNFLAFFLIGLIIAFLFDIFRSVRKSINFSDLLVYLQDILFLFISGTLILNGLLLFNNGELRLYIFVAIVLGNVIYVLTLSNPCVIIMTIILKAIKNIIKSSLRLVFFPIHFIKKVLLKIISFVFYRKKVN